MKRVPKSHIAASIALQKAIQVFACAEALAETIENDYGEDVLLQPSCNGSADNFSARLQVKGGTFRRLQDGRIAFDAKNSDVTRWSLHSDSVIFVIVDNNTDIMYARLINNHMSVFNLLTSDKKTSRLFFTPDEKLDVNYAKKLIWTCRMNFYNKQVEAKQSFLRQINEYNLPVDPEALNRDIVALVFLFLADIELVHKDGQLHEQVLATVKNCIRNGTFAELESLKAELEHAVTLSTLGFVDQRISLGMPPVLLTAAANLIGDLLEKSHADHLNELGSIRSNRTV